MALFLKVFSILLFRIASSNYKMSVHFCMYNGIHVVMFYVQRNKIMPIKIRDGLTSSLILFLVVTWISILSAFFQTFFYFSSILSGILQVLKGLKSQICTSFQIHCTFFFWNSYFFLLNWCKNKIFVIPIYVGRCFSCCMWNLPEHLPLYKCTFWNNRSVPLK